MSGRQAFSREEQALEEYLGAAGETVAVCVTEPFHPGAQMMLDRLTEWAEGRRGFEVVHVGLESVRHWARSQGVYGTPCILVFRGGRLLARLNGVFPENRLGEFLADA